MCVIKYWYWKQQELPPRRSGNNPTGNHETAGLVPGLTGVVVIYGVGRRYGSDPTPLWLWCRLAAIAVTGIRAWEPPYAASTVLKSKPKKKKERNRSSCDGLTVTNPPTIHEDAGLIPGLTQ